MPKSRPSWKRSTPTTMSNMYTWDLPIEQVRFKTDMRKRYKNKLKSCALCKPHKRGWALRWRSKELAVLVATETELRNVVRAQTPR